MQASDKSRQYDVHIRRVDGQISMQEVRKSPSSEDVEDYIEYKRLRDMRHKKLRETPKRLPKHEQLLGVRPAFHARERVVSEELQDFDDSVSIQQGTRQAAELGISQTSHSKLVPGNDIETSSSNIVVAEDYFSIPVDCPSSDGPSHGFTTSSKGRDIHTRMVGSQATGWDYVSPNAMSLMDAVQQRSVTPVSAASSADTSSLQEAYWASHAMIGGSQSRDEGPSFEVGLHPESPTCGVDSPTLTEHEQPVS